MIGALRTSIGFLIECSIGMALFAWAWISRFKSKKHDIGIGPLPLINNPFHKLAMQHYGYDVETFAYNPYYITRDFDKVEDWSDKPCLLRRWHLVRFAFKYMFRYRCLYLYFNGHILGLSTRWLWRIEPRLLKLAGIKTVILGYGGDVQDMRRSSNLLFRHAMNVDYPNHFKACNRIETMIDLWSGCADHVTGGCEWVDYQTRWDTLMLAHFSIDPESIQKEVAAELDEYNIQRESRKTLRVVNAVNHKMVKGTNFLKKAVLRLQNQGYDIELKEFFRMDHKELLKEMALADVVADQFVVGWYAMFTLEALSMEKPVLCYLRDDLLKLYQFAELIQPDEIPIINTSIDQIELKLKELCDNRCLLPKIGKAGREYLNKHHSIQAVGKIFDSINRSLGILPQHDSLELCSKS